MRRLAAASLVAWPELPPAPDPAVAPPPPPAPAVTTPAKRATAPAAPVLSRDASQLVGWVAATRDNANAPYMVIDKRQARLWVFDGRGIARGSAPVLLGSARGDQSVPGIGLRPIEKIERWERTTPAGRFPVEAGLNTKGEDIFWIDYDAAVSMHRVRATKLSERRLQRLASPTAADNRISYGCINVPKAFYERVIQPRFGRARGIVYILPESSSLWAVFGDLATRATARTPVVAALK